MKNVLLLLFGCVIALFTGCVSVAKKPFSNFEVPHNRLEMVRGKYYINDIFFERYINKYEPNVDDDCILKDSINSKIDDVKKSQYVKGHINSKYPGFLGHPGRATPIDIKVLIVTENDNSKITIFGVLTLGAVFPVDSGSTKNICKVTVSPYGRFDDSYTNEYMTFTRIYTGWILNYIWLPLCAASSNYEFVSFEDMEFLSDGIVSPEAVVSAICNYDALQSSKKK